MTIWLDWDLLLLFLSLPPSHFLSPAGQLERVLLFYFNWGSDVIGLLHAGLFNLDPGMCVCLLCAENKRKRKTKYALYTPWYKQEKTILNMSGKPQVYIQGYSILHYSLGILIVQLVTHIVQD